MNRNRVRIALLRKVARLALSGFLCGAIVLDAPAGEAQECGGPEGPAVVERESRSGKPLSAGVARTWVALHEATIRPLPDRTPLRQVIEALKEATQGKGGWADGIVFDVVPEALLEREITLDAPVTLPFVGRPEVSVDMYLKYLLHEFTWERYVGEGRVVIDSPCDDGEGYATISAAEAHSWRLLHESAPPGLPRRASLGEFLAAVARATGGKGRNDAGFRIYPDHVALRAGGITLQAEVTIESGSPELGNLLRTSLGPLGLAPRVLTDGTVMITTTAKSGADAAPWYDFPEYRFSYSFLWKEYVRALSGGAPALGQRR